MLIPHRVRLDPDDRQNNDLHRNWALVEREGRHVARQLDPTSPAPTETACNRSGARSVMDGGLRACPKRGEP